jgi:hypothetical protein
MRLLIKINFITNLKKYERRVGTARLMFTIDRRREQLKDKFYFGTPILCNGKDSVLWKET